MSTIEMTPCESSNVAAWGYQDGTLAVQFKSGATYHYAGVPPELVAQLNEPGTSVGSFISKNIRGSYDAKLVEPEAVQDE